MAVVYAFLADGLEEVECLATADVLIRAGVKVKLVSITGKKEVKGDMDLAFMQTPCCMRLIR